MPVKILIADDEPNQLELLSYNLAQAGFDVAQAHDGQAALAMIEDWHPDLVVLDWMMPHMSGIKKLGSTKHLTGSFNQDQQKLIFLWPKHHPNAATKDFHPTWE